MHENATSAELICVYRSVHWSHSSSLLDASGAALSQKPSSLTSQNNPGGDSGTHVKTLEH